MRGELWKRCGKPRGVIGMYTGSVTTGVLWFDGDLRSDAKDWRKPELTAELKGWLAPLLGKVVQTVDPNDSWIGIPGIALFHDDGSAMLDCDALEEGLLATAQRLGIASENLENDELLLTIGEVTGAKMFVEGVIADVNETGQMSVENLVALALRLAGEHRARGAALNRGYFSTGVYLWSHGGGASVVRLLPDGTTGEINSPGVGSLGVLACQPPSSLAHRVYESMLNGLTPSERKEFVAELSQRCAREERTEAAAVAGEAPRQREHGG